VPSILTTRRHRSPPLLSEPPNKGIHPDTALGGYTKRHGHSDRTNSQPLSARPNHRRPSHLPFALASAQAQASHIPPEAFLNDSQSSQLHQLIRTKPPSVMKDTSPNAFLRHSVNSASPQEKQSPCHHHCVPHPRRDPHNLPRPHQISPPHPTTAQAHRQHVFGRALRDRSQHASDDEERSPTTPPRNQLAQSDVPQSSPVLMDDG